MKKLLILFFLFLFYNSNAQYKINGEAKLKIGDKVKLISHNGFGTIVIDSTIIDSNGGFKLKYFDKDLGMGYLLFSNDKPFNIVLAKENIFIKADTLNGYQPIDFTEGNENRVFGKYAIEYPQREQAILAWKYLQSKYLLDTQFGNLQNINHVISDEIVRIKNTDSLFLSSLPVSSYMSWYLPVRKLISSVSTIVQYSPKEIPNTIIKFRAMDYSSSLIYKSGLLKDLIEQQFVLLENSNLKIDIEISEINISIDDILKSVSKNQSLYNEIASHLFLYFEQHSLFTASSYLALKVLSNNTMIKDARLVKMLESYRKMKLGNIAPDIKLGRNLYKSGSEFIGPNALSEIKSQYKVVIFGASWCNSCGEEMAQLIPLYEKWKSKGVEVVFISLDTEKKSFLDFTSVMPFFSYCDFKKWDTQAAKDYFISSSPTLYLLDNNNKIILRPNWIKAIDAWFDYTFRIH